MINFCLCNNHSFKRLTPETILLEFQESRHARLFKDRDSSANRMWSSYYGNEDKAKRIVWSSLNFNVRLGLGSEGHFDIWSFHSKQFCSIFKVSHQSLSNSGLFAFQGKFYEAFCIQKALKLLWNFYPLQKL